MLRARPRSTLIVLAATLACATACQLHAAYSLQCCLRVTPLDPRSNPREAGLAAAQKAIPSLYPGSQHKRYEVAAVCSSATNAWIGVSCIPVGMCGGTFGAR